MALWGRKLYMAALGSMRTPSGVTFVLYWSSHGAQKKFSTLPMRMAPFMIPISVDAQSLCSCSMRIGRQSIASVAFCAQRTFHCKPAKNSKSLSD